MLPGGGVFELAVSLFSAELSRSLLSPDLDELSSNPLHHIAQRHAAECRASGIFEIVNVAELCAVLGCVSEAAVGVVTRWLPHRGRFAILHELRAAVKHSLVARLSGAHDTHISGLVCTMGTCVVGAPLTRGIVDVLTVKCACC
jgi:hypothetical protein